MLTELFTWLTNGISGNPAIAISAAFVWGILSIVLSPCHLSSIPLIIGFINKQGRVSVKYAFFLSLVFAIGILITVAVIGLITASLGRLLGDLGQIGNYLIAIIFFVVGLYLLNIIKIDWGSFNSSSVKQKGWLAALILGLLLGIGLGPCTFAYMAPMLAIVFQVAGSKPLFAIALLAAFGIGHCFIIVLAGTLTEKVQQYLNWTEKTKGATILRKVCGVLVILGGIYLFFR